MGGSMKILVEAILSMYDSLSIKAINLIRERKARKGRSCILDETYKTRRFRKVIQKKAIDDLHLKSYIAYF
jgi:hypothetical protein